MPSPDNPIHRYHDGTKHHFTHFARSLGYLDWASQPNPFRSFPGARAFPLHPAPGAPDPYTERPAPYDRMYDASSDPVPASAGAIGDLLRHSLGLSAWKRFRASHWSLRVNPSSGNLHPTEAYVVCGRLPGLADDAAVYHYAADRHVLEQRASVDDRAWSEACGGAVLLMALTSIHWRESWKYGERAFRYCQHDLGHAVAAVTFAAATLGWRTELLPAWSHADIASLTGLDRDEDFVDAERESPGCLLAIGSTGVGSEIAQGGSNLVRIVRDGRWSGRASQLSEDHVAWTFIDEIAHATEDPGRRPPSEAPVEGPAPALQHGGGMSAPARLDGDARSIILQRRSAVAFDGVSSLPGESFFGMLARVMPGPHAPWDALWWTPRIHLLIFVHRVAGVEPGVYLLGREHDGAARLDAAIRRDLDREPAHASLPLVCLSRGDCRVVARRLSCDQDIASDGFFSLAMIADFDASLAQYGPSFYRHLFWESGVVGQVLYLDAEAFGVRATGIGCFYDDPVHDLLGLQGHAFQSLYHFTVGTPVEDGRLTTEPGYDWG